MATLSSATLLVAALVYMQKHEDHFSTKESISAVRTTLPIYLYKRFEELSTVPFYVGRPLPIINSESHDLWYGKQSLKREDLFPFFENENQKQHIVYVMKRDREEFLKKHEDSPKKIIYASYNYSVFLINNEHGGYP